MRVVNEQLLKQFRGRGQCDYCQRYVEVRHAAHIFGKGAGRVDIPGNLLALCAEDHHESHAGKLITRADLLRTAAEREVLLMEEIEAAVHAFRRHPKHLPIPKELE